MENLSCDPDLHVHLNPINHRNMLRTGLTRSRFFFFCIREREHLLQKRRHLQDSHLLSFLSISSHPRRDCMDLYFSYSFWKCMNTRTIFLDFFAPQKQSPVFQFSIRENPYGTFDMWCNNTRIQTIMLFDISIIASNANKITRISIDHVLEELIR